MKSKLDRENDEIECLLEAIFRRYGYDFRHYSKASIKRRLRYHLQAVELQHISEMIPKIFHDESFFELLLNDLSIPVTQMFRDPEVFKMIREKVVPKLHTYPRINVWHAGCATGEEAYSLAILLQEEGLLDRCQIYATDFNVEVLNHANKGIYKLNQIQNYHDNYLKAGGKQELSDYYHEKYESIKFKSSLSKHITFAHHNLANDQFFAQMHLIFCRNVLIYFDQDLQKKVLNLCLDSLINKGFLVLGDKETLDFSAVREQFEDFSRAYRLYRKI